MKRKNQKSSVAKSNALIDQWQLWLLASLTLGLAPFTPEPHLWGKLKWVWGGFKGVGRFFGGLRSRDAINGLLGFGDARHALGSFGY